MNHEHSQTEKTVSLKRFGDPKGHEGWGKPKGLLFCLNIGKLEEMGAFSLEKLVNHLL